MTEKTLAPAAPRYMRMHEAHNVAIVAIVVIAGVLPAGAVFAEGASLGTRTILAVTTTAA
jgi:hypothetical protein